MNLKKKINYLLLQVSEGILVDAAAVLVVVGGGTHNGAIIKASAKSGRSGGGLPFRLWLPAGTDQFFQAAIDVHRCCSRLGSE